jgi:uncharacterized membrane protein
VSDGVLFVATLASSLGCGLIAGAFFAFSAFVMQALGRLPAAQGITAMQSINVVVLNPWFLGVFLGTGVLCLTVAASALLGWWSRPGGGFLLAGCLLYVLGTVVVTMAFNVPRNDALAAATPATDEGARLWAQYLVEWTRWNHVRTVAALLAAGAFALALR